MYFELPHHVIILHLLQQLSYCGKRKVVMQSDRYLKNMINGLQLPFHHLRTNHAYPPVINFLRWCDTGHLYGKCHQMNILNTLKYQLVLRFVQQLLQKAHSVWRLAVFSQNSRYLKTMINGLQLPFHHLRTNHAYPPVINFLRWCDTAHLYGKCHQMNILNTLKYQLVLRFVQQLLQKAHSVWRLAVFSQNSRYLKTMINGLQLPFHHLRTNHAYPPVINFLRWCDTAHLYGKCHQMNILNTLKYQLVLKFVEQLLQKAHCKRSFDLCF